MNKKGAFLGIIPLGVIIFIALLAIGWVIAGTYLVFLIARNILIGGLVTFSGKTLLGGLSRKIGVKKRA